MASYTKEPLRVKTLNAEMAKEFFRANYGIENAEVRAVGYGADADGKTFTIYETVEEPPRGTRRVE